MKLHLALALLLLLPVTAAHSEEADVFRGQILMFENCPGDKRLSAEKDGDEIGVLAGFLTPFLTGVISQGIKSYGAKLTRDASETNVDVIHRGDYFYTFNDSKMSFYPVVGCIVLASKSVLKSKPKDGISELVQGYHSAVWPSNNDYVDSWMDGSKVLSSELEKQGFLDEHVPGIFGVFDVEYSAQHTEIRLSPRFIVMNHSVREKRTDSKERTITFEFSFESPHSDKPFASALIKLDALSIGKPFVQKRIGSRPRGNDITSEWFSPPTLGAPAIGRVLAHKEMSALKSTTLETAELARVAAEALGDNEVQVYKSEKPPCPAKPVAQSKWLENHGAKSREESKPLAQQDKQLLARVSALELYFKSCFAHREAVEQLANNGLAKGEFAGAFDLTVTMKEFRERPFAQFFGAVLSNDTTVGALTTATLSTIDPATRAAADAKNEAEQLALREAYESAVVAAETAIAAYDSSSATEKPQKFIDMEAKKRAANRRARALGISPPYTDSGFWY